jgi:hypothetical protein
MTQSQKESPGNLQPPLVYCYKTNISQWEGVDSYDDGAVKNNIYKELVAWRRFLELST